MQQRGRWDAAASSSCRGEDDEDSTDLPGSAGLRPGLVLRRVLLHRETQLNPEGHRHMTFTYGLYPGSTGPQSHCDTVDQDIVFQRLGLDWSRSEVSDPFVHAPHVLDLVMEFHEVLDLTSPLHLYLVQASVLIKQQESDPAVDPGETEQLQDPHPHLTVRSFLFRKDEDDQQVKLSLPGYLEEV